MVGKQRDSLTRAVRRGEARMGNLESAPVDGSRRASQVDLRGIRSDIDVKAKLSLAKSCLEWRKYCATVRSTEQLLSSERMLTNDEVAGNCLSLVTLDVAKRKQLDSLRSTLFCTE